MSKPSKAPKELSSGCLSLFGLPFMIAGLFMTGFYFHGYLSWIEARSWQETPCWIEKAELETSSDSEGGTTYKATSIYRYTFEGQNYHSTQVGLGGGSDNIGDFQQQAHRELAEHARQSQLPDAPPSFRCFVNPDQPQEAVLYRHLRWEMQAFLAIFALTFPAVGTGLVVGGIIGNRWQRREKQLRDAYPDEPWKWKPAWSRQPIPENASFWSLALHSYTVWSGAIIFSLIAAMTACGAYESEPLAWLTMIFVALWAIPAWQSLKRLRHRRMVGRIGFEATTLPYHPGGTLEGSVLMKRPPPYRKDLEFTLGCERSTTTRNGKNDSSIDKEKVWSKSESVSCDAVSNGIGGYRIPLQIAIPADAPESGKTEEEGRTIEYRWLLEFRIPGTPVRSIFEVPVFRDANTPQVPASIEEPSSSMADEAIADLPARLAARRLQTVFDGQGMPLSITCPAIRNRSLLGFLIAFNLIWTAVTIVLFRQDAPLLFRSVWSVSATGIWLIIFWQLLHRCQADFGPSSLSLRNQLGPIAWSQALDKNLIRSFRVSQGARMNNTQFYKVQVETVTGKHATVADNLTDNFTAGALATRLNEWRLG